MFQIKAVYLNEIYILYHVPIFVRKTVFEEICTIHFGVMGGACSAQLLDEFNVDADTCMNRQPSQSAFILYILFREHMSMINKLIFHW
jgi:hypothetical protein